MFSQGKPALMDGGKCSCQPHSVRPFLSAKYDITKNPRYRYLSDANKKNTFDVEKYRSRIRRPKPSVKPDEVFDYYEIED
jgi:type IV secretion system protein VirD4